jgi:DMSO/TMAO reductase YedYZ molybdopterin-dependent catalytic subunit
VCRGGIPDIDPKKHRLLIHGMVDRPLILTMDDIKRLPSTSRTLFLECACPWLPYPTMAIFLPARRFGSASRS